MTPQQLLDAVQVVRRMVSAIPATINGERAARATALQTILNLERELARSIQRGEGLVVDDQQYHWLEVTTLPELSQGRRTFVRGPEKEKPGAVVTPAAVDAFERFGTDEYGGIVDVQAGLVAALKMMGIPVKGE